MQFGATGRSKPSSKGLGGVGASEKGGSGEELSGRGLRGESGVPGGETMSLSSIQRAAWMEYSREWPVLIASETRRSRAA